MKYGINVLFSILNKIFIFLILIYLLNFTKNYGIRAIT
ncbi:hypothetical protein ACP49_05455 [Clostridium botulinum]|uniref:Uncharacterized protein n=1 Tax=Clostridium botulinum (strain Kyoto / Type A2) TaxID=536232 RepID=C1FU16_CLOBJ|nr:hypothetical protein CLM_0870 [Clostridium botulinum A2 str. Kyoto]KOM98704.1 hypothetical protein ACP53_02870 [Clostridium botulinum]CBZ02607.1 hypothetical protein H04402_00796 [Clostridium botulinum H04402 065]KON00048.1 hypothetical protein ACP49_05455 [Clostridium botulinum]OPD23722.1 hypothetical protein AL710_06070 [Clostridium botulinum]